MSRSRLAAAFASGGSGRRSPVAEAEGEVGGHVEDGAVGEHHERVAEDAALAPVAYHLLRSRSGSASVTDRALSDLALMDFFVGVRNASIAASGLRRQPDRSRSSRKAHDFDS